MDTYLRHLKRDDLPSGRMHLYVYSEFAGLNTEQVVSGGDDSVMDMKDVETITPNLIFLDITKSAPSFTTSYYTNPGVNGSLFEYNNVSKSQLELSFWLHELDYKMLQDAYRDVCAFFGSQAYYYIATSYHPSRIAKCIVNKIADLTYKSMYDATFTITLDNPLGLWFTEDTGTIQYDVEHGSDRKIIDDLDLPVFVNEENLNWTLKPGHNQIPVLGDQTIKASDPSMDLIVAVENITGDLKIINHSTNTSLSLSSKSEAQSAVWYNLDVHRYDWNNKDQGPINQYSGTTDFWLAPVRQLMPVGSSNWKQIENGYYNDIELVGSEKANIYTRFYYNHF